MGTRLSDGIRRISPLVIDTITAGGKIDAPVSQRVFWASFEGLVAIALLLGGGYDRIERLAFVKVGLFTALTICAAAVLVRRPGAIDPAVAKSWERYDIRLVLERNWKTLGPKLKGKLHVYMGDLDTFYLEGATALLKQSLASLKSDAKVELFKGKDHGSLMTPQLRERIEGEMAARLKAAGLGG